MSITFPAQPWTDGQTIDTPRGRMVYYPGKGWKAVDNASRLDQLESDVTNLTTQPPLDSDNVEDEDTIQVWRAGVKVSIPIKNLQINSGGPQIQGKREQIISNASGEVVVDQALGEYVLFASTLGAFNVSIPRLLPDLVQTTYITVLCSGNGHAMTFNNAITEAGIPLSEIVWTADKLYRFEVTQYPHDPRYFVVYKSAKTAVQVDDAEHYNPTPDDVPDPNPGGGGGGTGSTFSVSFWLNTTDTTAANDTPLHNATVGSGTANYFGSAQNPVLTIGINDPYDPNVQNIRLWADYPEANIAELNTWATVYPSDHANFVSGSGQAPFIRPSVPLSVDPTGGNNPTWLTDGVHKFYIQTRFKNGTVEVCSATVTIDNNAVAPPTAPAVPTGLTVVSNVNNRLVANWNAVTGCTYEFRYGTANPPATATPVAIPTGLTLTVNGLTGASVQRCQVRSINASGVPSDWSSVVSVTIQGTGTGGGTSNRVAGGTGKLHRHGSTFGPRSSLNTGANAWIAPWGPHRSNVAKDAPATLSSVATKGMASAAARYASMVNEARDATGKVIKAGYCAAHPDVGIGPRFVISVPNAWSGATAKSVKNGKPSTDGINSCLSLATMASGGYDTHYEAMFNAIKNYTVTVDIRGTNVVYNDWPTRTIIGMAHENNGDWYASYSGIDTGLIGHPSLVNASNAVYGSTVAALLRQIGVDGNRGPLFKYGYQRMVDIARTIDERFIFMWTWTNAAADPGGSGVSNAALNYTALPDTTGKYIDIFSFDVYCRGSNKSLQSLIDILAVLDDLASDYGCRKGLGECNAMFQDPAGVLQAQTASDAQAAPWLDHLFNWINTNDVAFYGYWNAQADKVAGSTFYPDPTTYPSSTAIMKKWFPRPAQGLWPMGTASVTGK